MDNELTEKENKPRQKKKFIIYISIILCLLIFAVAFYMDNMFSKMKQVKLDDKNLEIKEEVSTKIAENKTGDIVNIALFGVDEAEHDTGRSDAIMIGTLDPINNKLKVTSLMRDSYVDIPDHGSDKLNHAYAYGGPELSIKTINKNFDLNITDYVKINFEGLESVINVLGGIDLDLSHEEYIEINKYIKKVSASKGIPADLVPDSGMQKLTGFQTLGYCRIRSTSNGDFDRTQRHRNVINSILNKVSDSGATQLTSIVSKVLPYVETSLSTKEILSLGINVLNIGNTNIEQQRFPLDDDSENILIDNVFYLKYNEEKTREEIYEYIFHDAKTWLNQPDSTGNSNYSDTP